MDTNIIENNIDKLITLIEDRIGFNSVLYIELISVEIKENSFFKIAGKGYNKDNYLLNVKEHLREEENSSLLLMKHESDSGFIFLQKEIIRGKEVDYQYEKRIFYSIEDRKYHKIEELRDCDIEIQWEKWLKMAQSSFPSIQHACFLHSDLTIPYSQNSVNIISGVWVFFSKPVSDLQELSKILKTGIYEYIIYTLLPDKVMHLERQDTFNLLWHSLVGQVGMLMKKANELETKYGKDIPLLDEEKLTNRLNQFREYFSVARCIQAPLQYIKSQQKKGVDPQEVSLNEIIKKIIEYIYYDIEHNHNSFSAPAQVWRLLQTLKTNLFMFSSNGNDKIIFYDAIIEVIFYNLITNAIKNIIDIDKYFDINNIPKVAISISPIENDNDHIRFSIRNARCIDDIHYENWLDDRFAHYEHGKRTSGLGIYTCKSFINALNISRIINRGVNFTEIIIDFPKQFTVTI